MTQIDNNLATNCALNLMELIEGSNEAFAGKVWHIYSEDELKVKTKGIIIPAIGVIYDGLRPIQAANTPSPQQGSMGGGAQSSEMTFTIIALLRLQPIALDDPKAAAITQIDAMRRGILRQKSPSGHFWRFQLEVSAPNGKDSVAYIQRWNTTVQLN